MTDQKLCLMSDEKSVFRKSDALKLGVLSYSIVVLLFILSLFLEPVTDHC